MSARVTIWAWAQAGRISDSTSLIVLLGMADIVRDHGRYFGNQQTLAEKVKMTARTVRRSLAALAEAGLVEIILRPGRTDIVQLKLSPVTIFADGPEEVPWDETQDIDDTTQDSRSTPQDSESYDPGNLPKKHNPKNAQEREGALFENIPGIAQDCVDPDIFEQAWALWPEVGKRRSAKAKAHQLWAKLRRQVAGQSILLMCIQNFVASPDALKDGGQFVPGLDRWLRDGKWEAWNYVPRAPTRRTGADDWQ